MKLVWFGIICAIFNIIDAKVVRLRQWNEETGLYYDDIIFEIKLKWKERFRDRSYMDDDEVRVWTLEIPKDAQDVCCDEGFKKEVDGYIRWLEDIPVRQRKLCMDFAKSLKQCKCEKDKPNANQRQIEIGMCPPFLGEAINEQLEFKNVDPSAKYCYAFNEDHTSWPNAEFICQQYGGHLASFHSEEEIKVATSLSIYSFSWTAWIGLNTSVDGQLKWSDGTEVNYMNYAFPNTGPSKGKCAEMIVIDYKWFESDCNKAKAFYCAVPKIIGTVVKRRRGHGEDED